jgi:hypothetical protein
LVSQPVAPAALAWPLISVSDSVVRKMIGTPAPAGRWRSSRIMVRPSMTGMFRSVMIRSNPPAAPWSRPSWPLAASVTA